MVLVNGWQRGGKRAGVSSRRFFWRIDKTIIHAEYGSMQKIQVLFPNPIMAKLRGVADQEDRPVSELIRRAVERFLEMKPQKPACKMDLPTFKGGEILVSPGDLKKVIYEDDAL